MLANKTTASLFPHGRWLLCPPTYFDVEYEINPWMHLGITPDKQQAPEQWKRLHHTLIRLGAFVEYVDPAKHTPDLVFTANAGLVLGKKVVLSHFKYKERQEEEPIFRAWFAKHGFDIMEVRNGFFEGEGDALFAGSTLFCGWGFRSEAKVYDEVCSYLGVANRVLCQLCDARFYHLDTCFCPLDAENAIFYPGAFSKNSISEMEKHVQLFPVPARDAARFVCNAVVLGKDVILPAGCDPTYDLLGKLGFTSHPVELGEFLKGGGSAKCLSLRVDRSRID